MLFGELRVPVDEAPLRVSVVIPAYNSTQTLPECLKSIFASQPPPFECIVVDDGSSDGTASIARQMGARVLGTGGRRGPSVARNRGAAAASGEVLLFVDSDVCIHPDALSRILARFAESPDLDAVFGSYDDKPAAENFLSQYKNLQHSYFHQTASPEAHTFWCGCGAIRRDVFLALGGLDESVRRPAVEDVEFGYRLVRSGGKIVVDRKILGCHLKRWSLGRLLKTEIFDRAIPWTRLIVRYRFMPNALNLRWSQRASALLALGMAAGLVLRIWWAAALPLGIIVLNAPFYRFLFMKRGLMFSLAAVPFHLGQHFYSAVVFLLATAYFVLEPRSTECPRIVAPVK